MAGYTVSSPLVVATDESGSQVYVYQGQPVPSNIGQRELDRLLDGGFIAEVEEVMVEETETVTIPDGDPSEEWSNKELDAYAAVHGHDIKAAKNKAEKLAAFAAASA